jgi:hypothetical protein
MSSIAARAKRPEYLSYDGQDGVVVERMPVELKRKAGRVRRYPLLVRLMVSGMVTLGRLSSRITGRPKKE